MRIYAAVITLICATGLTGVAASAAPPSYSIVYSFPGGADGSGPIGLTSIGHTLYGTTGSGGSAGYGTIFSLDPATGSMRVLYSFQDTYGTALTNVGGTLFGVQYAGGSQNCQGGCGRLISFNTKTGMEQTVYSFTGGGNGFHPIGNLINVGGMLYGVTEYGGSTNCQPGCGTIFSLDPATGAQVVVYKFQNSSYDGAIPSAGLANIGTKLYGTSDYVGTHASNTLVFSYDIEYHGASLVYAFKGGSDASESYANLTVADGVLYGTSFSGGTAGLGTVFSVNPTTGAEQVLHSFTGGKDGEIPFAGLVKSGVRLYGGTTNGGEGACSSSSGCGVAFSVNSKTGFERIIHTFGAAGDVDQPQTSLIKVEGVLYGAALGGASGHGAIYAIMP